MISQKSIELVKSTAPILQQYGETLTRHFYKRMFLSNPDVSAFFNVKNQAIGTQQRALANAISAYAENIKNLDVLHSAIDLIANKHASLMIKPEHYPIVGENLLASIKEVLGDNATDEVFNAWREAYCFLSELLINRENQIYNNNANKSGGWHGFRNFKVIKKEKESSLITSFYLQPEDKKALPHYFPGQYITLRVPTPDGFKTMRNYSLSDKPGLNYFRISIKREVALNQEIPAGIVSNILHDKIDVEDILEIGPPCGDFFLNTDEYNGKSLVLLAAGVGITPILSILNFATDNMPEREIILIYGCKNQVVQPFKHKIEALSKIHSKLRVHYRFSNPKLNDFNANQSCSIGKINMQLIESLITEKDADYYFCGPKPFMSTLFKGLLDWGIPNNQIHFEFFGPKEDLQNNSKGTLR
ncbi:NO-inducible flavohemoprotein [Thorsellia kenyensis]|uniref:nitric oxide dioxygenase n=1 Tax=Thorsellia kenyensis TaxID=1549888 RepID=A0ABV6C7U6_9GAMM